jgi:hypothetical protein
VVATHLPIAHRRGGSRDATSGIGIVALTPNWDRHRITIENIHAANRKPELPFELVRTHQILRPACFNRNARYLESIAHGFEERVLEPRAVQIHGLRRRSSQRHHRVEVWQNRKTIVGEPSARRDGGRERRLAIHALHDVLVELPSTLSSL